MKKSFAMEKQTQKSDILNLIYGFQILLKDSSQISKEGQVCLPKGEISFLEMKTWNSNSSLSMCGKGGF